VEDSSLAESRFLSAIKGTINKAPKSVSSKIPQTELAKGKPEILTSPTTSPNLLNDEISEVEQELIAAINAIHSSQKFVSLSKKEFPPITSSPTRPNTTSNNKEKRNQPSLDTTDLDIVMTDVNNELVEDSNLSCNNKATKQKETYKDNNKLLKSFFVAAFPENFSSDWTHSLANNYEKPNTTDRDDVDASLFSENERRLALCLSPFSKEFFLATGQSKLQNSEDYQELIRVMVWRNRSRIKQGLTAFSPEELETFLKEEMSQNFDDLDIHIDDFLADLIKIRHAEQKSFDVYNEFIKNNKKKPQVLPKSYHQDRRKKNLPQKLQVRNLLLRQIY
jgi:hypothetical protein